MKVTGITYAAEFTNRKGELVEKSYKTLASVKNAVKTAKENYNGSRFVARVWKCNHDDTTMELLLDIVDDVVFRNKLYKED